MASQTKSRWANDEDDTERRAQLKREKEEKKRLKAEKLRKLEQERLAREAATAAQQAAAQHQKAQEAADGGADGRPAKRPRLSPGRDEEPATQAKGPRLLRFDGGTFGPCRTDDDYEKLNDIEEGAYGWVSRAKHKPTGQVVAIKRLKMDPKDRSGLPVTGLREIQVLKYCSHRNIVQLREVVVGKEDDRISDIFLVLEFVEHDLKSILDDMPTPFLASEVKTLLLQLASGTAYLHQNHILHRDLKTSNILLNNRGCLKIADFGMARILPTPPPPSLTQLVVTLWYRAPELLLGAAKYGPAIDVWSIGCIFAELLTREPLFQPQNEVEALTRIFELCGVPSEETWPGFRRLPNARGLRLPPATSKSASAALIRAKFPLLTASGASLLAALLSLDPDKRPSAEEMLRHDYFSQDPKPKQEAMFPTFPSKAGQERRRRRKTPNAPVRRQGVSPLSSLDFSGIFAASRDREERGAGFSLRMV